MIIMVDLLGYQQLPNQLKTPNSPESVLALNPKRRSGRNNATGTQQFGGVITDRFKFDSEATQFIPGAAGCKDQISAQYKRVSPIFRRERTRL